MRHLLIALVLTITIVNPSAGSEPATTLSLDAEQAAEMAVASSPLFKAQRARQDEARARAAAAAAENMPSLDLEAAFGRQNSVPEYSAPLNGPSQQPVILYPSIENTGLGRLVVHQPLYTGGSITARREASLAQLDATSATLQRAALDLRAEARLAFWRASSAEAGLKAARAAEVRARALQEDVRALVEAGMAVQADLLAARSRYEAARVETIARETDLATSLSQLRSLTGVASNQNITLIRTAGDPAPPESTETLVSGALDNRPELATVEAAAEAASHEVAAIEGGARPSLALVGDWSLARPNSRYFPLEEKWHDSWTIQLRARWNLFDGGRREERAAAGRHYREELDWQRAEQERRIRLEVEIGTHRLYAALSSIQAAETALTAAREREIASRERHEAGIETISDVLEAQADLAAAEFTLVRTRAEAWAARVSLDRAIGR